MDPRRQFGNDAENLAARFLVSKGMKILERQYRERVGEIDIIARDKNDIVFVEVKARKGSEFGYPEESVTDSKLRRIQAVAEVYLQKHGLQSMSYRIDVVAIEYRDDNEPLITIVPVVEV
jgi:putative endonuclease